MRNPFTAFLLFALSTTTLAFPSFATRSSPVNLSRGPIRSFNNLTERQSATDPFLDLPTITIPGLLQPVRVIYPGSPTTGRVAIPDADHPYQDPPAGSQRGRSSLASSLSDTAQADFCSVQSTGGCPGLNALANFGYISRSGITDVGELLWAMQEMFGFAPDLAGLLVALSFKGMTDLSTLKMSIGGTDSRTSSLVSTLLGGTVPGLFSQESHNKFEHDGSLAHTDSFFRPDGNTRTFNASMWAQRIATANAFNAGNFGPTFVGPDGLQETPTLAKVHTAFGIQPQGSSFVKVPERLPLSSDGKWYRRATGLTLAEAAQILIDTYLMHPVAFGANSGSTNSFIVQGTQLDADNLSVKSVGCLLVQQATENIPVSLLSIEIVKWTGAAVLVSVGCCGALLYSFQSLLIYPSYMPQDSRTHVPTPDEFEMPYEQVNLTTPDGVRLHAYLIKRPLNDDDPTARPQARPTVLLLHANAGNVGHRLPIAKVFWFNMRCNVFALSYRGYGLSEGTANEKGLKLDAQTALDYILSHPELEKTNIFLYGQSIGGAVAIHLASRNANRIRGLIVENTFLSLPKLVPTIMPYLSPFMFLLHQIWPSEDCIRTFPSSLPVLFLGGERDELIPPAHMVELHKICPSKDKEWRTFPHGTHNDTCVQPTYFQIIADFIFRHAGLAPANRDPSSSTATKSPTDSVATSDDGRSTDGADSFVVVDEQEGREIKDEGGAGDVNVLEKVKEKLAIRAHLLDKASLAIAVSLQPLESAIAALVNAREMEQKLAQPELLAPYINVQHHKEASSSSTNHATSFDASNGTSRAKKQFSFFKTDRKVKHASYPTSSDERGYIPVAEINVNRQTVLLDTENRSILFTSILKAVGKNAKADMARLIETEPERAEGYGELSLTDRSVLRGPYEGDLVVEPPKRTETIKTKKVMVGQVDASTNCSSPLKKKHRGMRAVPVKVLPANTSPANVGKAPQDDIHISPGGTRTGLRLTMKHAKSPEQEATQGGAIRPLKSQQSPCRLECRHVRQVAVKESSSSSIVANADPGPLPHINYYDPQLSHVKASPPPKTQSSGRADFKNACFVQSNIPSRRHSAGPKRWTGFSEGLISSLATLNGPTVVQNGKVLAPSRHAALAPLPFDSNVKKPYRITVTSDVSQQSRSDTALSNKSLSPYQIHSTVTGQDSSPTLTRVDKPRTLPGPRDMIDQAKPLLGARPFQNNQPSDLFSKSFYGQVVDQGRVRKRSIEFIDSLPRLVRRKLQTGLCKIDDRDGRADFGSAFVGVDLEQDGSSDDKLTVTLPPRSERHNSIVPAAESVMSRRRKRSMTDSVLLSGRDDLRQSMRRMSLPVSEMRSTMW
ncbi:bem46 protein, variant [Microbotryomycetes sp. JL201]|nr:bem46 protein, variant [Microbotryomycetes sp. JL201]